ncbi:MAG: UDP-N-acetylmuramoylalanine--D-glutamate ligase [Verrucomicrobiota bacterium]|jgi:UDP-N-acetylmuramoylalanine--D-glutamate ligase
MVMNQGFQQYSRVAVLGAGESGVAAAKLLAAEGVSVTVVDAASPDALRARAADLAAAGIGLRCGSETLEGIHEYQRAVLSPGIDPATPLVRAFVSAGIEMVGELELAFERCACPVVAITGTNGKTTTTQLVDTMFNAAGVRSVACGNIGPAFSARVSESREWGVATVEASSFQLETVRTFHPKVAVWLNFAPDHLDRYPSIEEYRSAKLRIFENLDESDWAVVNARDPLPVLKSKVLRFSAFESGADFEWVDGTICFRGQPVLAMADTHLRGAHNAENLMAALGVGFAWGLDWKTMAAALSTYRALPHRCEWVRNLDGVDYVNDSKATNLDALEKALQSETRPVILIAGGKDKGFEFESVTELVAKRCRAAVLIGEMAARIEASWGASLPCRRAATFRESVLFARELARPGDVVLLSPGTSSFDMFQSYADRGNQFRSIVQSLSSSEL